MIIAAALCPAPPLLARELTGVELVLPELQQACQDAVHGLLAGQPDLVTVVTAGPTTATWPAAARLDLGCFASALAATRPPGQDAEPALPVGLGLGARLLDQAEWTGPRLLQSVGQDERAADCAELGASLAGSAQRVALLVLADGAARRESRLDEQSATFDAEVTRAVRDGDLDALLAIDPRAAEELLATGRPAWQVLAGALHGTPSATQIRYAAEPFGVSYLVASLQPVGLSSR